MAALFTTCLGVIPTFCLYAPADLPPLIADAVKLIQGAGGMIRLRQYVNLGLFLHTLECVYTIQLCQRHRTGLSLGVSIVDFSAVTKSLTRSNQALYVISTFLCGFPIWLNLKQKIRTLRIDSVMKLSKYE